METGKRSLGMEVSHILKALSVVLLDGYSIMPSMRVGMKEGAKWQFYRTTHSSWFSLLMPSHAIFLQADFSLTLTE